jgi:hypothetical protein
VAKIPAISTSIGGMTEAATITAGSQRQDDTTRHLPASVSSNTNNPIEIGRRSGSGDHRMVLLPIRSICPASIQTICPASIPTICPASIPTICPASIPTICPASIPTICAASIPTICPASIPTMEADILERRLVPVARSSDRERITPAADARLIGQAHVWLSPTGPPPPDPTCEAFTRGHVNTGVCAKVRAPASCAVGPLGGAAIAVQAIFCPSTVSCRESSRLSG